MGRFVNPDNSAFQVALNSRIYVDKTGAVFNELLDEAYQLGWQIDLVRGNPPELKYFWGLPVLRRKASCHGGFLSMWN